MSTTTPAPAPAPRTPAAALPALAGVAVATPPDALDQDEMLELLGLAGDPFAETIFARCGVRRRHVTVTAASVRSTLQARTAATERQLSEMAVEAVGGLAFDPARIGVVVSATYYSLGGPTLAHQLVDRFALDPDVDKYHLLGVGCASAVPLLRIAAQALRDRPAGEQALVVAAECCSGFLGACAPGDDKVKIVGSSLFADGAGAALLTLGEGEPEAAGPTVRATAVHQVPGTLDDVRFAVAADDAHLRMSRSLPAIAATRLRPLVDGFLRAQALERGAVDHWLIHPGGRGIVEGVQEGLGLSDDDVAPSVAVLAERGNVGTPSAFFVLDATERMRAPRAGERGLMVTIGPGVTVGLGLLEW